MTDYTEYFLNSRANIVQYELLEISHPNFSEVYRYVRNNTAGLTVTLEDASVRTFDYYPLRITPLATRDVLDFGLRIDLGDVDAVIQDELDRVLDNLGLDTKPVVRYWTYRSDDLTKPLYGPVVLELTALPYESVGASFVASSAAYNSSNTGELFDLDRFPMLRGFL